jgi:hypothetical protein
VAINLNSKSVPIVYQDVAGTHIAREKKRYTNIELTRQNRPKKPRVQHTQVLQLMKKSKGRRDEIGYDIHRTEKYEKPLPSNLSA